MRDGVFTEIIRNTQTITLKEVTRRGVIIGPPIRTEVKKYLTRWTDLSTALYVNSAVSDSDYALSQLLKPITTDVIVENADIKFYLSKSNGDDEVEMVAATVADTVDELVAGVVVDKADYNATIKTLLDTLEQDHALLMRLAGGETDTVKIEAVAGDATKFDISDTGVYTAIEDGIDNIEVGDTFRCALISDSIASFAAHAGVISSVADYSATVAGTVLVTCSAAHGLPVTCTVTIAGTTAYDADVVITKVGANTFYFTDTFTETKTGTFTYLGIVVATCTTHGLPDACTITIAGTANYNGTVAITKIDANTFSFVDTFVATEPGTFSVPISYAKVVSIDTSANSIRVKLYSAGFGAIASLTDWDIFYDYHGATIGLSRNPRITFSITANRPSITGKYDIAGLGDLIDMFGENSIVNPDSILAYDSYLYYISSQSKFSIYAMAVDDEASGKDVSLTTADHAVAQGRMNALNAYFIVPCYRIVDAADAASVKAVLALYKTWVNARSSINAKREGRLYGALPIVNMGYGYTDASAATPAGLDLSEYSGELYINCNTDAQEDVDNAIGVPGAFDDVRVTLLPYYAYYGTQLIEGSSVAAVIAGERTALGSDRNLAYCRTNDPTMLTSVLSVEYFDDDQLDALKEAGWQMLTQASSSDSVRIYHQNTTDMETVEKAEEHLVIAVDSLCQAVRATLASSIANGIANQIGVDPTAAKTLRYLGKLNAAIGGLRVLYINDYEIFSNIAIITITPNATNPDQADIKIGLEYYYPVNRINVEVYA